MRAQRTRPGFSCACARALWVPLLACVSTTPPFIPDASSTMTPASDAGDAGIAEGGEAGMPPPCTVPMGSVGNELSVGMYCIAHENQCPTSLFCSADYVPPMNGFCTKLCMTDADCGSQIFCYTYPSAQGGVSVCVPNACRMGGD